MRLRSRQVFQADKFRTLFILTLCLAIFAGCDSDDDDPTGMLDTAPAVAGVWMGVSQLEECGDNVLQTLPQQTLSGITFDYWFEITDTTFQVYYDLSTFPGGFTQTDGLYYCPDYLITHGSMIDVDSIVMDDGTTIWFEFDGEQLVVRMEYDHDPGCTDTYWTELTTGTDFSGAISDCQLFEDEF